MKIGPVFLAVGLLLLYPFATSASDYGSQSPQNQQVPPVAQTLVREGDFAIALAEQFNLGSPTNDMEAEDLLTKAGVVPLNGWISDYPMTPEILGQLSDAIGKAAEAGTLEFTADEAIKDLNYLATQMNLPAPADTDSGEGPKIAQDQSGVQEINNYYYNQGPPIITYYPPPADYVYLYDWVPYPAVWFGFWFPGYYICHNFTTVVVFRSPHIDHRGHNGENKGRHDDRGHMTRGTVSNHVIDPLTKKVATVAPTVRMPNGGVRSETRLMAGDGRAFMTLADMRRESSISRGDDRTGHAYTDRAEGFRSQEARTHAASIFARSVRRTDDGLSRGSGLSSDSVNAGSASDTRNHRGMSVNHSASWFRNAFGSHAGTLNSIAKGPPAGGHSAARQFGSGNAGPAGRNFSGHSFSGGSCRGRC